MNTKYIDFEDIENWFGKDISDWTLIRSKYIFRNKSYKGKIDEPLLSVTQRDGVIKRSDLDNKVWNPSDDVSGYKLVEPNDFVISLRSFEGGIELSNIKGLVSPAYTVLETIEDIDSNYFRWMMKSYLFIIELNKHVSGIRQGKNIAWDDFSDIYLLKPSLYEQKLISQYLNKKTSKIDSLIEKIEKKIELLNEQKTALINQYVTKGLDSNVDMKDSRFEWIGDIPKHWGCDRVGRTTYVKGRIGWKGLRSEDFLDEGPYLLTGTDFVNGSINWSKCYRVDEERYAEDPFIIIQNDDVLITKDGSIGKIAHVREMRGPSTLNSGIFVTRPLNKKYLQRYFYWILSSSLFSKFIQYNSSGSTILHLYQNVFERFFFPLPPLLEQKVISQHLDKKTSQIDLLIEKIETKVKLLKEYHQSLISSVVTGKIRITEDMI